MINFNFNGESHSLRNTPDELTITEFEYVSSIINNEELDYIDKYMQIFIYLGLPKELVDDLDGKSFLNVTRHFHNYQHSVNLINQIEIDGYIYKAFDGDKYKPKVKDLKLIISFIILF